MFAVVLVTSLKHALNLRHKEFNCLKIMKGIGEFVILRVRIYSSSPTDALSQVFGSNLAMKFMLNWQCPVNNITRVKFSFHQRPKVCPLVAKQVVKNKMKIYQESIFYERLSNCSSNSLKKKLFQQFWFIYVRWHQKKGSKKRKYKKKKKSVKKNSVCRRCAILRNLLIIEKNCKFIENSKYFCRSIFLCPDFLRMLK